MSYRGRHSELQQVICPVSIDTRWLHQAIIVFKHSAALLLIEVSWRFENKWKIVGCLWQSHDNTATLHVARFLTQLMASSFAAVCHCRSGDAALCGHGSTTPGGDHQSTQHTQNPAGKHRYARRIFGFEMLHRLHQTPRGMKVNCLSPCVQPLRLADWALSVLRRWRPSCSSSFAHGESHVGD